MKHKSCLYYMEQHNEWCYHMNYVKNKRTDGVLCNKIRKKKYCPYHPTYKGYKHEDNR